MPESHNDVRIEVENDLARLDHEIKEVFRQVVLPTWTGELHGLTGALYGYMMGALSRVDLYSCYWKGSTKPRFGGKSQTDWMVAFMERYMSPETEAHTVTIHLWRHKLMHTAKPRVHGREGYGGHHYYWLLQWGEEHLPREQHYTLTQEGARRKLTIGLTYLIEDLRQMAGGYFNEVASSPRLQSKLATARGELDDYSISI